MSPDLALNPMERLETMFIMFYYLRNLNNYDFDLLLQFF